MPLSDSCVVRLGAVCALVEELVVDTEHFKGNYPESVVVEACSAPDATDAAFSAADGGAGVEWRELLPRSRLGPDQAHEYALGKGELQRCEDVTHVRVTIFPDGGIMRLRVRGRVAGTF